MAICLSLVLSGCSDSSAPASSQPTPQTPMPVAETTPQVQVSGGQPISSQPLNSEPDNSSSGAQTTEAATIATTTTPDDHEHPANGAGHVTRYTDSERDIWPPQPEGITNVIALNVEGDNDVQVAKLQDNMRTIKSDKAIADLIGPRNAMLVQRVRSKKSVNAKILLADNSSANLNVGGIEFFNYDTNKVISVELAADGQSVIRHSEKAAHFYQPPESQDEVKLAIELAAVALSQQGFTGHKNLIGTGLLAYPNAAQSAASGFNFYSERKIYVTFGTGDGELPEYRALVNLSAGSVESSGAIQ